MYWCVCATRAKDGIWGSKGNLMGPGVYEQPLRSLANVRGQTLPRGKNGKGKGFFHCPCPFVPLILALCSWPFRDHLVPPFRLRPLRLSTGFELPNVDCKLVDAVEFDWRLPLPYRRGTSDFANKRLRFVSLIAPDPCLSRPYRPSPADPSVTPENPQINGIFDS